MLIAISEATGRFIGEIEREMEADEYMLWADHFKRRSGAGQVAGLAGVATVAQLTARLKANGARQVL